MSKKSKTYKVWFRRPAQDAKEIGPQDVFDSLEATGRHAAERAAKEIAKERGWRFIECWAEDESAQISMQSPLAPGTISGAIDQ